MPGGPQTIERLSRHELNAPAYRQLSAQRFGSDNWEAQVRYACWLYDGNPASRRDEPLPIFVCRSGEQLIGQVGVIPIDLRLNGARLRGGWCVDLFVLPEYQGRRVGENLVAAVQRAFPVTLTLGQTDAAYRLARRLGWCAAGALTHSRQLLRPLSGIAKKVMEKVGLTSVAGAFRAGPAAAKIPPMANIRMQPVTSLADVADQQADLCGAGNSPTRIVRSAAFMQWRYCDHPFFRYTIRRLTIGGHGEAYAVWRVVDDRLWRRAALVDLVYPDELPQELITQIAAHVVDCVRAEGTEILECQTSDAAVLAALGKYSFSRSEPGMRFLYRLDAGLPPVPASADVWRLYASDGDADTHMARRLGS